MHILIFSGDGDLNQYIADTAIRYNFFVYNHLDEVHFSKITNELILASEAAVDVNKGLCFVTQRIETIKNIINHFKGDDRIEYIRVGKDGVNILDLFEINYHLENGYEMI